jgi:hypothetical protein
MPNELMSYLTDRHPARSQEWNAIVQAVTPLIDRHVEHHLESVSSRYPELDLTIAASGMKWQLIHGCVEVAYSDLYPPTLFLKLTNYYLEGYYPCGWEGDFPNGLLVVF